MGKKSPCLSCKHKNVYEPLTKCFVCNFSGTKCKNFEMYKPNSQTNADRIRAMTYKELASFLWNRDMDIVEKAAKAVGFTFRVDKEQCLLNVLDWLSEEVENE